MFYVANIHCINPETLAEEVIRVTTRHDYIDPSNDETYSPHLKTVLNYSEQLFGRGSTSGEANVGVGEVVLDNVDGTFDQYRHYGFDGQKIEIFLLNDELEETSEANLFFRGTMTYPSMTFKAMTLFVMNKLQLLEPDMQVNYFAGDNEGGPDLFEGNLDLKGKIKPMVWGTALNIPPAKINTSLLIFGCNYDSDGERAPLAAIFNVADKGGAMRFEGDCADLQDLIDAEVSNGFYMTCLAEGLFKLGTVPKGEVTADVAEVLGEDSSAARTVQRILEKRYGLQPGIDYDVASMEALHYKNSARVGYYVDGEVTGLEVITQLMESIGGWIVPDRLGIFRCGRFDLPSDSDVPVATFDEDIYKKDSLERIPTGDEGRSIPAKTYVLNHTKLWKVLQQDSTLVSIPQDLRDYYANEFRSVEVTDLDVTDVHPLAPTLSDETLMLEMPGLKVPYFLESELGEEPSTWSILSDCDAEVVGNDMLLLTAGPDPGTIRTNLGWRYLSLVPNNYTEVHNGMFAISFYIVSGWADFEVMVHETDGVTPTNLLHTIGCQPGLNTIYFVFENAATKDLFLTFIAQSSTEFGRVSVQEADQGLTVSAEAHRRLDIQSSRLERFVFEAPVQEAVFVNLGDCIVLKAANRFSLDEDGMKFIVIGKDVVTEEESVTLDVVGAE